MKRTRLLLIDTHGNINNLFKKPAFKNCTITESTSRESEVLLHLETHDLIIITASCISSEILALIKMIRSAKPELHIIGATEEPSSQEVVAAYRAGLSDYFFLPLNEEKLCGILEAVCEKTACKNKLARLSKYWNEIRKGYLIAFGKTAQFIFTRTDGREMSFHNGNGTAHHLGFDRKTTKILQPPTIESSKKKADFVHSVNNVHIATPNNAPNGNLNLEVASLGKLKVKFNKFNIENWPSRKGRGIFAYIATSRQKIYRDILMEKFWPDAYPESARNCLNVALHGLRRTFNQVDSDNECLLYKDECYYLNPDLNFSCDVHIFRRLYQNARSLENEQKTNLALAKYLEAVKIYRGDFMEDDLYEEWPTLERENLREKYFNVLERLSYHYIKMKKFQEAIQMCQQILNRDSCREDVHRKLMLCHYYSGQRDRALIQFQRCQKSMHDDLGVVPSKATIELKEKIRLEQIIN
ncbi:MAG: hypothetical protein DWQ05_19480 [Calditrichaeota bacterium]|nr:MAG: hypothetical protein DWQ05_19480 [Calditrichota bacterium]